jgi:hypothetical protein
VSKRSDKRKRRMVRAKEKGKALVDVMHRLSPGCKVTYKIDGKRQRVHIKVNGNHLPY